ncbi:hypothetical protein P3342_004367 [Pyrenophora teres f. teres]|nr:hypothetical protein P3342_004367 [Pyrenophora teres f. teres]
MTVLTSHSAKQNLIKDFIACVRHGPNARVIVTFTAADARSGSYQQPSIAHSTYSHPPYLETQSFYVSTSPLLHQTIAAYEPLSTSRTHSHAEKHTIRHLPWYRRLSACLNRRHTILLHEIPSLVTKTTAAKPACSSLSSPTMRLLLAKSLPQTRPIRDIASVNMQDKSPRIALAAVRMSLSLLYLALLHVHPVAAPESSTFPSPKTSAETSYQTRDGVQESLVQR